MRLANADASSGTVYGATHILLQAAGVGETKYCTNFMVIDSESGISGLTLGNVFLGINGAMSSSPYTDEGDIDQCIGFAETTAKIFLNIGLDVESYLAKANGTEVNTGTDNNKYITPQALADSDYIKGSEVPANETDPLSLHLDQTTPQSVINGIPTFQGINHNSLYTPTGAEAVGTTFWDTVEGTLSTVLSSQVKLQHGRELHFYGKAVGNVANGELCQYAGVQGDHILIKKCVPAEVIANPFILIGPATETFTNGNYGRTTWFGKLNGVYTKTPANGDSADWVAGDELFFSNVTGQLTKTAPNAPEVRVCVGFVVKEQTGTSENGIIEVAPEYGNSLQNLDDVDGTPLSASGQFPVWNQISGYFDFTANINNYKHYAGFENRTDSTLTIDGSGVVTLAPAVTSFNVWANATKYTYTTPQTVTITEDQNITYVYIDVDGVLKKMITPWDIEGGAAPTAIVFKDGTNYAKTDERHGYDRNRPWHKWAHFNIGCMYRSGLTGTFTDTTLSITQGKIADEDIDFDTGGTKTTCTLWYRNATTGMRMIRSSTTPYYAVTGVLQYDDGDGTTAGVTNNRYSTQWVYASNDATEPIYVVIGQNNDVLLSDARNATAPIINLSTAEWKLIYRIIYRNAGGTPTFIEASDLRTVQTGVPTSATTSDHSALINRDAANSHPATAISYDNGGATLSNVQTEIARLSEEVIAMSIALG